MVKDLDGFRVDVDLRVRNGRSVAFLEGVQHPFEWARFSATQGNKENGAVFFGKYLKQIRNVNGFNTTCTVDGVEKVIHATPAGQILEQLKANFPAEWSSLIAQAEKRYPNMRGGDRAKLEEKAVEQVFDLVARAQLTRQTGFKVEMSNWSWNKDGYNSGLNSGLNSVRSQLFQGQIGTGATLANGKVEANKDAQTVLSRYFNQYRTETARKADDRTWTNGRSPAFFRLVEDGSGTRLIEGITRSGLHVGWAIMKTADANQMQTELQAKGVTKVQPVRFQSVLSNYAAKDLRTTHPMPWLQQRPRNNPRR